MGFFQASFGTTNWCTRSTHVISSFRVTAKQTSAQRCLYDYCAFVVKIGCVCRYSVISSIDWRDATEFIGLLVREPHPGYTLDLVGISDSPQRESTRKKPSTNALHSNDIRQDEVVFETYAKSSPCRLNIHSRHFSPRLNQLSDLFRRHSTTVKALDSHDAEHSESILNACRIASPDSLDLNCGRVHVAGHFRYLDSRGKSSAHPLYRDNGHQ